MGFLGGWRADFKAGFKDARALQQGLIRPVRDEKRQGEDAAPDESGDLRETVGLLGEVGDQLRERVNELEAERGRLAEILRLPSVKNMLLAAFHPDAHPDADDDRRRWLTESFQKITDAYALIGDDEKEPEP